MAQGVKKGKFNEYKFRYALDMYIRGKWNQEKCCELLGCSKPTLMKYFNMYYLNEEMPDGLFEDRNGK